MRTRVTAAVLMAVLVQGCSSTYMPTSQQLGRAIANSTITVTDGDKPICTHITLDSGRSVEVHHVADKWEAWRACSPARWTKSVSKAVANHLSE